MKDVTRTNRFPPWTKRPTPQRIEFKFINDQYASDGTETVLRWAQKAILNPTTPPDVFITKAKEAYVRGQDLGQDNHGDESPDSITLEDRDEAQFSPNTIALEVSGPGLEELSFYDLPGIIMTAQREEDRFLTEVIRNFSREYISHPGAMILWALPMNNDPECSAAGSFIGDAKAFDRCIGVMTKADLLPQGNVKNWLQMLENKSHVTGHGYFVTYRTNRPGITLNEQNLAEDKFFNREMESDETVFWPEEFDKFRARCGLQNLKHHLSWKLAAQFAQVYVFSHLVLDQAGLTAPLFRLPELKSQIAHQLEDITRSLEGLPEVPENKELEIMQSLSKFADLVRSSTQSRDFLVRWGQIADHFRDRILGLKPKYVIKEPPVIRTMEQDGLEMFADIVTITTPRKRPNPGGEASPSKRPRMARPAARSLSDMREIIRNSRLPGQNDVDDADFYAPLLLESLEPWTRPLADFVEYTIRLLKNMLVGSEGHDAQAQHGGILGQAFARLTKRDIYTRSRQHINAFIDQRKASLMKQLQAYYAMELQRPFTQDGDRERHNREKEKAILTRARTHQRMLAARIACGQEDPDVVLRERLPKMEELTEEQLRKEAHTRAKNEEKLGPDPYGREISVMAHVRGYYLTAAFRFIDVVSMHIISRLFPEVQNEMDDHLQDKLGLKAGPGRAQQRRWDDLMAESPGIVEHRKQLKAKKENLGKALESIVSLERELGAAVTRQTTPPARSTPARSTPARSSGDDTEMLDVPGSGGTRTAAGSRQPSVYAETMGNGAA